jgi:glycosyltransferase involved in cell wall biosynthesis
MANVSICIPTYNQSAYLERAIRSAYNQTYKPKEIIVCDDCSTDETRFVLERLTSEISILTVFYQPINLGILSCVWIRMTSYIQSMQKKY